MKAKSNLKAVENQGNNVIPKQNNEDMELRNLKQAFEKSELMTDISAHLYFVSSVLSVISDMDGGSPGAFEKGDVQHLALEGRIRIDEAINLLNF